MACFTKVEGKDIGGVKLFALSTCGWCRRTKKLFDEKNIAYSFVDVDLMDKSEYPKAREEQLKLNPNGSFPTILIRQTIVIGYDEAKLNELIGEDCEE